MLLPRVFPLVGAALGGVALAAPAPASDDLPALRTLAAARGLQLGVAVSHPSLLRRPQAQELVRRHFDAITPENALKWGSIAHQPHRRDTAAADALVGWAREHGLAVKGHALAWDQEIPGWLLAAEDTALAEALDAHIAQTLDALGAEVAAWDVANEVLEDDGGLGASRLLPGGDPDRLDAWFRAVDQRQPDALLLLNDYGLSAGGPKAAGLLRLVDGMQARGVPIDGVGIQSHLDIRHPPPPGALPALLSALGARGLVAHISELDVRIGEAGGARWGREAAQAWLVHRVATACIAAPACTALTVWGLDDGDHWTARAAPGPVGVAAGSPRGGAVLFEAALRPKLAAHALAAALAGQRPAFCDQNVLEHGDLEDGAGGWSTGGGRLQRSEAARHGGTHGLHHDQRSADWQGPVIDLAPWLGAGLDWDLGMQLRHDGPAPAPLRLTLRIEDDAGERFVPLAAATAPPGRWTALSARWTPELDGPLQRAELYVEGPAAGVALDVDDARAAVHCPD